ncbi:hypothetical protein C8R48DRAFT_251295 [Suillus tomentosus]|nr:hypothetical protein C8R48DRAFT_251295 [Suillus tomentosus]
MRNLQLCEITLLTCFCLVDAEKKCVGCSTAAWSDSATVNKPRACRAFLSSHISPHTAAHSLAMYSGQ